MLAVSPNCFDGLSLRGSLQRLLKGRWNMAAVFSGDDMILYMESTRTPRGCGSDTGDAGEGGGEGGGGCVNVCDLPLTAGHDLRGAFALSYTSYTHERHLFTYKHRC